MKAARGGRSGGALVVTLASGEQLHARQVLATCDPRQLFLNLLAPGTLTRTVEDHALRVRARGTLARWNVRLAEPLAHPLPRFSAPSLEALERAFDAAKYGAVPERPALQIDASADGLTLGVSIQHVAYVGGDTAALATRRAQVRAAALSELEALVARAAAAGGAPTVHVNTSAPAANPLLGGGTPPARATSASGSKPAAIKIAADELLLPEDLEQHLNLSGGHVLHGEPGLDQILMRPFPEAARAGGHSLPGLTLCGSGAHPGASAGLAPTCLPGLLATR